MPLKSVVHIFFAPHDLAVYQLEREAEATTVDQLANNRWANDPPTASPVFWRRARDSSA